MNYCLNEEKMFMDISDGIAVVINSESGIYYGMNPFGTAVFDAVVRGMDTDEIVTALKTLPSAPTDIEKRISDFVEALIQYALIVPGAPGSALVFDEDIAQADAYMPEVLAYDDAQEMLLADPIHEVKEETGWTPEKESIRYSKEETREREKKVE